MDEYDERNYRGDYRYDERNYRPDYRNERADYRGDERADYRADERADYRGDYRYDDRRRDYDRRGGKINYRNYRGSYHEELEMVMQDMREQYRKLEDVAEMAEGQDKNMLTKIAQKEKENYTYVKQLMEK